MKLPLDPGNALGHGCWETIKRVFVMMSTLWMGCIVAVASFYAAALLGVIWTGAWGDVADILLEMAGTMLRTVLLAPFYILLSLWGFFLVPLMAMVMFFLFRSDNEVRWLWFSTVVVTGIIAMKSMMHESSGMMFDVTAWAIFVLLMISLAAGCWVMKGWERNSQAQHLQEVNAENERRRLEIEKTYGTTSFGQGNQTDYLDE